LLGADVPGVTGDWSLVINGSQLGAGLGAGTGGCGSDFSLYGGNVTDGNPHIGMYVRVGGVIKLYVDGVLVASQNGLCPEARVNCPFDIGAMTGPLYFFHGDIAEIQIYNRTLTSWEIMSVNETLAAAYGIGGAAGTVVAWGSNSSGQTNVPASMTNLTAVASGSAFNLALQAGGTVTGWGDDSQGQTTVPAALTNVAAISGGVNFSLAIGNQPPVASNAVVSGYVNHDLLIALTAFSPDGVPINFHVESLPLSGALYQNTNGARGALINTPSTLVSDAGGQVIFAPASGETGSPDVSFGFLAEDGMFDSGLAQVTVNIAFPTAPQFTGYAWSLSDSNTASFALNFTGDSNATYTVWASTDLVNWTSLGTAIENPPGQYQFIDLTATNWPQRFYRLSAP
jgi:Concanavalin A-like lectin/glucanases superfamily